MQFATTESAKTCNKVRLPIFTFCFTNSLSPEFILIEFYSFLLRMSIKRSEEKMENLL